LSLERVFKALVSLGLSQTDARVYMFLALKGPKKAKVLVDNLKLSRQQIHRSLKHLQGKGIIVADVDRQGAFSALLFEKALELLIETEKAQTQILQETKETALSEWKTMRRGNRGNC
jgi:sugar-specific transcriptional regulator TrmB